MAKARRTVFGPAGRLDVVRSTELTAGPEHAATRELATNRRATPRIRPNLRSSHALIMLEPPCRGLGHGLPWLSAILHVGPGAVEESTMPGPMSFTRHSRRPEPEWVG